MKLTDYWISLTEAEREAYAARVGTTAQNIACHYIPNPRKVPKQRERLKQMADASGGKVSHDEVLAHFFKHGEEAA